LTVEIDFLTALKAMTLHEGARGLADDAAVLGDLVLTHDMIVEGVHFLPSDPPADVAWKLIAVSLSDLAAKGAVPIAGLLGAGLSSNADWNSGFLAGLKDATAHFGLPLLGGDTVVMPPGAPTTLGLTAIGRAGPVVPSRSGARPGDAVYVAGVIGDARLGLVIARAEDARGDEDGAAALLRAYRRPVPLLETGRMLSPVVTAMMDVSDGLLIDALRLADASGVGIAIDLDAIPMTAEAQSAGGGDRAGRLSAATGGDDYALLFTSAVPLPAAPGRVTRIGRVVRGAGLFLSDRDGEIVLPEILGWLHN
jgi:thiamine-monophosphate kinase